MKNLAVTSSQLALPYCEYLETSEPQILLNSEIGIGADGSGIDPELFARVLKTLDQLATERGYKRLCVMINSGGGEVEGGMSIYDAILTTKTPVDTYVTGRAASMAGVIAQAGRKRYMMEYAQLMLHNPHGTDNKKQLKAAKASLVKMLSRHGISEEKVDALMNRESWILADEAKDLKLCDEVVDISEINKTKNASSKESWAVFQKTLNTLKKKAA